MATKSLMTSLILDEKVLHSQLKKQQFCANHMYQLIRFLFWRERLHDAIKLTISTESYIYILHTWSFFLEYCKTVKEWSEEN